jgi:YegS/Rv2252/BmrU family lipid kinase
MKTVAIVNPVSGFRRAPRVWPRLLESLGEAAAGVTTWWTEAPGHGETLGARARREGFERVVAVGGDGTFLEVVNGLWWEKRGQLPSVGMIPFGRGCDYVRNFDLGLTLKEKALAALQGETLPVSLGLAHLQVEAGKSRVRVFMNVLGLGFDGQIVARFRSQHPRLPGKIAYFLSGLEELPRLTTHRVSGSLNGRPLETEAVLIALGLGRYFGGGMMVTPGASPQAARFQVVMAQRMTPLDLVGILPRIYLGKHLDHPEVAVEFAGNFKLEADPPALVEADGELVGFTPLEVMISTQAIQFAAPCLSKNLIGVLPL